MIADPAALIVAIDRMPVAPSPERRASWMALIAASAFAELAEAIMALHYDPAYDRSARKQDRPLLASVDIVPTEPESVVRASARIAEIVAGLDGGGVRRDG